MEALATPDVSLVEVAILVLERHILVEPQRPQVRKYWISSDAYTRGVTAGSVSANAAAHTTSSRRVSAGRRLSLDSNDEEMLSQHREFHELQRG